jgi:hypothetical protein
MRFLTLLGLGLISGLNATSSLAEGAAGKVNLYGQVLFTRAADLDEYRNVMKQTREEVRGRLGAEYESILVKIAQTGQGVEMLAGPVLRAILAFDGIYRQHRNEALRNIDLTIAEVFKTSIDQFYREEGLQDASRKIQFLSIANQSTHFARGTYSVLPRGQIQLTLTVVDVVTGAEQGFQASGPVLAVSTLLARQVFHAYQGNRYENPVNPTPTLRWLKQPGVARKVSPGEARRFCEAQGARLPFTRELLDAALLGPYRDGGIDPLIEYDQYIVADRQREDVPHFFSSDPRSADATGGPVHTTAGHDPGMMGYFWCVKGEPSAAVRMIDQSYQWIRYLHANPGKYPVEALQAFEAILIFRNEFGNRAYAMEKYPFQTEADALAYLRKLGLIR